MAASLTLGCMPTRDEGKRGEIHPESVAGGVVQALGRDVACVASRFEGCERRVHGHRGRYGTGLYGLVHVKSAGVLVHFSDSFK